MIPAECFVRDLDAEAEAHAELVAALEELEASQPGLGWAMLRWMDGRLAQRLEWRAPTTEELRALMAGPEPVVA